MKFLTDNKTLTIEMQGQEQLWALKNKIIVLKKDILKIEFIELFKDWRKWEVRLPGTGMPGKLVAGSFWTEQGWDFIYLKNPHGWLNPLAHNVLFIETKLPKFKRIILSSNFEETKILINWAKS
jgi:hypothetical protein